MTTTQTQLFDPPVYSSGLSDPIVKYLFTLQRLHPLVEVDTTAGNVVIALPSAGVGASGQSNQNQEIIYRKISGDANTVTITGSLDGPIVLTTGGALASARARFKSNGAGWRVVG